MWSWIVAAYIILVNAAGLLILITIRTGFDHIKRRPMNIIGSCIYNVFPLVFHKFGVLKIK